MARDYTYTVMRPGGEIARMSCTASHARIRHCIVHQFRAWFGRDPDKLLWHSDGFMAGAEDKRGNEILMEQTNWGDPRHQTIWKRETPKPAPAAPLLLTWPELKGAA